MGGSPFPAWADMAPDDGAWARRPGRGASSDDLEPGPLEHRERAAEHIGRRDPLTLGHLDGIGLEQRGAVVAGVVDAGNQERVRDPATAGPSTDDEADDRPGGLVVDGREDVECASRS